MTPDRPDSGHLESAYANDPDMIELVQAFVSELPDKIHAIQDASDRGDIDTLRVLVHQLKGAAGGYGFPSISEASAVLESSVKAQQELAAIKGEVDALVELCQRVRVKAEA